MSKFQYVYTDPTLGDFTSSNQPTPYGTYDSDLSFISESVDVARYVSRKLGHPVMQLEFNSSSIWACFEEASSDYSQYINNYNAKNWLWEHYSNTNKISGSGYSNNSNSRMGTGSSKTTKPSMGLSVGLSKQYGEAIGLGGDVTTYSGSITLVDSQQVYDLQTVASYEHTSATNNQRLTIQRIFNEGPSAITKFYDPYAGTFDQRNMLDSMGMGNVSPATTFMLRPIYQDISRAAQIETNDKIRKSNYSFELVNNKLRIFPAPKASDAGNKIWFNYQVKDEATNTDSSYDTDKVSDPSNVPYKFITYEEINAPGRQWIRRYTLALAKELLGIIRSKYATMPIPNGEVQMDGEALKAEGREEKQQLIDELKEFLDSVSVTERARAEQEQAESQQQVLNKAPLGIYLG